MANNKLILPHSVKQRCQKFMNNPESLPAAICFCGSNGVGKTSLAEIMGIKLTDNHQYKNMSYINTPKKHQDLLKVIEYQLKNSRLHFGKGEFRIGNVFILDEFHTLSPSQQNAYTDLIERYRERDGVHVSLFIIIVNVDEKNKLEKVLTKSILNRVYPINVDFENEDLYIAEKRITGLYPGMPSEIIRKHLPSFRPIMEYARVHGFRNLNNKH